MLNYRVKRFIDSLVAYWLPLTIVFFALSFSMFVVSGVIFFGDFTQEETVERTEFTRHGTQVSSTVSNAGLVLQEGSVIERAPLYALDTNPEIVSQYSIQTPRRTQVNITTYIEYQGIFNEQIFWNERVRVLNSSFVVEEGERESIIRRYNMNRSQTRIFDAIQEYNARGRYIAQIVTEVEYETDEYAGRFDDVKTVRFTEETYSATPVSSNNEDLHQLTRTVLVQDDSYKLFMFGGFAPLILGVISGLAYRESNPLNSLHDYKRKKYREWISFANQYEISGIEERVDVNSIDDLVDVAIDVQSRVLWLYDREMYVVVDGAKMYKYELTDEDRQTPRGELPEEFESKFYP